MKTLFTLLIVVSFAASAQEPAKPASPTPLSAYLGKNIIALIECGGIGDVELIRGNSALRQGKAPSHDLPTRACISEQREVVSAFFKAARDSYPPGPAREALKNYHIQWIATLETTDPNLGDSLDRQDQRMKAANEKLSEAWSRFELEQ